jgi:hypothetical protein
MRVAAGVVCGRFQSGNAPAFFAPTIMTVPGSISFLSFCVLGRACRKPACSQARRGSGRPGERALRTA